MYNAELKTRFLEEGNIIDNTKKFYTYILNVAEKTEQRLNKDIYEFTPFECDQLILSYSRRSEDVLQVTISVLKKYVDFCEKINLTKDYNYFSMISGSEDVIKYLDVTAAENKFITFDQLKDIHNLLYNPQDAVLVELPFIGLKGKEADEIRNLRVDQVYPDKIVLKDREIIITPRSYEIIKDAVEQTEYLRGNGETKAKSTTMDIIKNDYVLRTAGKESIDPIKVAAMNMRMDRIKRYFGNPYMNITNIWYAGMLHQLKMKKKDKNTLEKEDYQEICRIFGTNAEKWHLIRTKFQLYL